MEENVEKVVVKHEINPLKKQHHKDLCYLCLEAPKNNLILISAELHKRLIELGIAVSRNFATSKKDNPIFAFISQIVKTSISTNSLCYPCFASVQSSLETVDRVHNANIFWSSIYLKLGHRIEKSQLPAELKFDNENSESSAFKCLRCELHFMNKRCLNKHIWKDHLRLTENPETCYLCGKTYQNEWNCYKHVFSHHEEERNSLCTICGKSGMTKALLRQHCISKHDGLGWADETNKLFCNICKGVRFHVRKSYDEHMYRFHGVEKPMEKQVEEKPEPIQVNNIELSEEESDSSTSRASSRLSDISFQDEANVSENDSVIKLDVRIEETSNHSVDSIKYHAKYSEGEYDDVSDSHKNFDQHMNMTLENRQCPQCNDSFSRHFYYLHLWEHFRSQENPSVCKFCDKELTNEEACRKHFLFKHFEKYQICDICGEGDMTRIELQNHKKYRHPDQHKEEVEARKRKREELREKRKPKVVKLDPIEVITDENDYVMNLDCPHCDVKFNGSPQNVNALQHKHVWEEHKKLTSDPMQCPHCEKHFEAEFLAKKHYFCIHFEPYYSCHYCQKSEMTYKQLVDHIRHESKLLRSGIEVSKWDDRKGVRKSKDSKNLKIKYVEEELKKEKYTCQECEEKFFGPEQVARSAYFEHSWQAHGKGEDPKRCDKCRRRFESEFYARKHYLHRHFEKFHICDICNQGNFTKNQLYHHKIIVHSNSKQTAKDQREQLDCPYCCQKFKDPIKFKNHKRNHQETATLPKFVCESCNKVYNHMYSLKEHQRRAHLKVFSHICRYCDRGFFSSGSRNLHEIQVHTKEYPFECRVCGAQSAQIANLKLHIKRAHEFTNEQQISETIIRLAPRKRRTKDEIESQKIYIQHRSIE